jgi:soluble lytic murein transglycosylase-like protein
VPAALVRAIIRVESGDNRRLFGRHGEIGLMQVKLETAQSVGYRGSRAALFVTSTNIAVGTAYLPLHGAAPEAISAPHVAVQYGRFGTPAAPAPTLPEHDCDPDKHDPQGCNG